MLYNNDIDKELLYEILDRTTNPCICIKISKDGENQNYEFIYCNKAFEQLNYPYDEELMSSAKEVFDSKSDIYKIIEAYNTDRVYNIKGSMPIEDYVVINMTDITELTYDRNCALKQLDKLNSYGEKLKYQVDLQNVTIKKMEDTIRMHNLLEATTSNAYYYKNYVNGIFSASDKWIELFSFEGIKPVDNSDMVKCMSTEMLCTYNHMRSACIKEHRENNSCTIRIHENRIILECIFHFVYNDKNELVEEIGFFKDVTASKNYEEDLTHKAYYDANTGLMNRSYFTDILNQDIDNAKKYDDTVEFMYIDIDNFKEINDSIGFRMADEFLVRIAGILKEYKNDNIKLGRFDSDEFVISMYEGSKHAAMKLAMDIKKRIGEPMALSNGLSYMVTVSIGIAQFPDGGRNAIDLISNADIALRHAKEIGKNSIVFFEKSMLDEFLEKMELENSIKTAIDDDRFELYYQPQYYTGTKRLRGVEALIRMTDVTMGFVSPGKFIPLAEKNGTIINIGEWVIRQALLDYKSWQKDFGYSGIVSINISPIQFKQITFESTLYSLIEKYDIQPDRIEIEITESVFIENKFQIAEIIKRIRSHGVKVSLDDFGTGYSSLSYLQNIPIDTLKIDKSFIDSVGVERSTDIITSSLIDMIKKLGIEIIAEGVETKGQYEYLKQMNCDNIQGYYLARPMDSQAIRMVIKEEAC